MRYFALCLLLGCAPAPQVLRADIGRMRSVAEQAGAEHKQLCGPTDSPAAVSPPPPGNSEKPARCKPLLACLDDLNDAGEHCGQALDLAGSAEYRAAAGECHAQQALALGRCARQLGFQPKEATRGDR
jgi:hypothetical protein